MNDLIPRQIPFADAMAIWAVPLSGFGHVADEQPMPYIQRDGQSLTPRFGGEEDCDATGLASLPIPYGKLRSPWPYAQRLFNFPRRRANIYWRLAFRSRSRADGMFFFAEQLNYNSTLEGFRGRSPVFSFSRRFIADGREIVVMDELCVKRSISFEYLLLCPWAEFEDRKIHNVCQIVPSLPANHALTIQSSTGTAVLRAHRLDNVTLDAGEMWAWHVRYKLL